MNYNSAREIERLKQDFRLARMEFDERLHAERVV